MIDGPVIVGIFERVTGTGPAAIVRHIAVLHIVLHPLDPRRGGRGLHGFEYIGGGFETCLHGRIGQHRDGMVATHAPALIGHQIPDGKQVQRTLLLNAQHAASHVGPLAGLQQVEQRMLGTVSVPQRKDGVVDVSLTTLMNLHVVAAIATIDIHIDRRVDHRMIERGIEE